MYLNKFLSVVVILATTFTRMTSIVMRGHWRSLSSIGKKATNAAPMKPMRAVSDDDDDYWEKTATPKQLAWDSALEGAKCNHGNLEKLDATLDFFIKKLEEGSLNLFPEYQRDFVWKQDKSSRLVITALCNRFMHSIVTYEKKTKKSKRIVSDVVDGKQRLASLISFVLSSSAGGRDTLAKHNIKPFERLVSLEETYAPFNGLSFADLSEENQGQLRGFKISYNKIHSDTLQERVLEIYSDINSGGQSLSNQQALKGVFFDGNEDYFAMLEDIVTKNADFQAIYSADGKCIGKYVPCKLENDREQVLRFFAYRNMAHNLPKTNSLKSALVNEMIRTKAHDDPSSISKMKEEFGLVMKVARDTFGEAAFRKWELKKQKLTWSKSIHAPLGDVLYPILADLLSPNHGYKKHHFQHAADNLKGAVKEFYAEGRFPKNLVAWKTYTDTKKKLFDIFDEELKKCVKVGVDQRNFPRALETDRKLFDKQSGVCPLCQNAIDEDRLADTSYTEIDHIKPWSKGGATEWENAQLTHRTCNKHKSNREE